MILGLFIVIVVILTEIPNGLSAPPDEFSVKFAPRHSIHYEGVDPEEKEVYREFRTSFIPHDEIITSARDLKNKQHVELILKSESLSDSIPKDSNEKSLLYQDDEGISGNNDSEDKESALDDDYESSGDSDENEDDDYLQWAVHSYTHVDRGPLDDVVEQIRGQPELEEGEVLLPTYFYNLGRSNIGAYPGIHSFWKGEGDNESIKNSQEKIMRTFMDTGADPCQDFYQYACGNWAPNNPIPPDKAGYDTFEMLRENLDFVLKDLLELKSVEHLTSIYPEAHLNLDVISLENILGSPTNKNMYLFNQDSILHVNGTYTENQNKEEVSEIVNRIRRYLDQKLKGGLNPASQIKTMLQEYMSRIETGEISRSEEPRHKQSKEKHITTGRKSQKITNKSKRHIELQFPSHAKPKQSTDDPAKGDAALKAQFLFRSCMDYKILQKRGHQPLIDLLNLLGGWPILKSNWKDTNFDWLELMARLRLYNNDILISEWVGPDIMNSDEFVIQFDQTSLGLPSRDYFLQEGNRVYLEAYKTYLIKIALLLGGQPDAVKRSADQLIEFEIKLANITSAPEDRRNVSELYQKMSLRKLESLVPEMKWRRYLAIVMNRTIKLDETVVLFALGYVRLLVQLLHETDSTVISNYLMWRFVRHRVNSLDDRFQSAKQQFYFILFGREQAPPRWKSCISQVNSNMGMALGSMFVRNYFDEISKNDTLRMTREIQQSFRELLHTTNWIDHKTKKLAADKVDAMMLRIGYPGFILVKEELDDRYKEVHIHPDMYFENILNILHHWTKMEQSRLGQPVNKSLWNTAPAVVNAYYSRNKNQILFPAGILQPPFYHRHFPRSLNYGGIGVVIGHEITHGFDDKGRLFDCDGNLHRWWSDTAIEEFRGRAQCLIDQYGKYVVPEVNMHLDGANTQGENIADNGGVKQAFRAYLRWVEKHGTDGETLPGLNHTHTQLFFLNFAQVWCGAMRPEAMRNKLKTAVHSPGRFRVIGTLSNSEDFAREFRCPPGSPMNPLKKCTVW